MRSISTVLASILVIAVFVVCPLVPASAGDYHTGETLNCSDCHISHASLSHDDSGKPSSWNVLPSPHLTKGANVVELCLQCHDNQPGIPDVVGTDASNPSEQYDGTERSAGQFADGNADNWKGHNLPGQGANSPGDCTACHDPHGNSNYRNLRALDGSTDGPVAYVKPMAAGLDRYRRSNIGYVKGFVDKLCVHCHDFGTSVNPASSGGGLYHRHPSSDASKVITIGSAGQSTDPQHWVTGVGSGFEVSGQPFARVPFAVSGATDYSRATTVTADDEVFCLSCHKAHGSGHAFGLLWPYGTSGLAGSSGCNQCHNTSGG